MGLRYEPRLDGLRAVAILALLGFHLFSPFVSGGSLGVDAFFVLSGYLITSILTREADQTGQIRYGAFLVRRARRLLPALAVLLVVYLVICPLYWPDQAQRRWVDAGSIALYVYNLRITFWPIHGTLKGLWSLSVEEQFYILWPFALLVLLKLRRETAVKALLVVWVTLTLARIACAQWVPGPAAYYFTPLHATGLVLGSALALRPTQIRCGRAALTGLIVLMLLGETARTFPYAIAMAEVLTALVIVDPPRFLAQPVLRFIGVTSYGTYLWGGVVAGVVGYGDLPHLAAVFSLTLAAGAASYYGVERWFLKGGTSRLARIPASPHPHPRRSDDREGALDGRQKGFAG